MIGPIGWVWIVTFFKKGPTLECLCEHRKRQHRQAVTWGQERLKMSHHWPLSFLNEPSVIKLNNQNEHFMKSPLTVIAQEPPPEPLIRLLSSKCLKKKMSVSKMEFSSGELDLYVWQLRQEPQYHNNQTLNSSTLQICHPESLLNSQNLKTKDTPLCLCLSFD